MSAGDWGIYKEQARKVIRGGFYTTELAVAPVIEFDALISIDVKEDTRITSYPVEEGGFTAAAKVLQPAQITVVGAITEQVAITKGGYLDDETGERAAGKAEDLGKIKQAIQTLEAYKSSAELLQIITPYKAYLDLNLITFSYKHTAAGGVSMLEATMGFQEVRSVKPQYTTIESRNPNYSAASQGGNLQAEKKDDRSLLLRLLQYLRGLY
jgi:hypothetical protein